MAWSPGMPVPAPGTPDYADYTAYVNAQGGAAGAASAAGTTANQLGAQNPGTPATPAWKSSPELPPVVVGKASDQDQYNDWYAGLSRPDLYDAAAAAGANSHGGSYDPFAAYEFARNETNTDPANRGAWYEAASAGTSQVRNPYDYVIGRDRDYVGQMAAQQQAIGAQAGQGYNALAAQAADSQGNALNLMGMGAQASAYGQQAAQGINGGASMLANSGYSLMGQGGSVAQRQAPQLDFGAQSQALGNQQRFADQLGNLTQGPSAAQGMLQAGANQSMAQSLALARSGRGFGGSAAGQAQALQQNAATMQNVSNQSAILRAQEDQAWRAQQAQNYAQAANIYGQVGSQFGQQQALSAQTQLAQQSANDQAAANLYGLGLQGQTSALGAQTNAAQIGLGGYAQGATIYGQGANLANQGTQLQGQLLGQGSAAQSQAGLNAFGMNQAQNATDMQREGMVSQEYGIRSGVALQNQQIQQQEVGSAIGAGAALGAGLLMLSDERAKTDIRPAPVDLRGAGSYSYQYAPGAGDSGSHVGPMAQELESLPGVVQTGPDGLERVDTGRLSLANAAATGDTQRRVDRLEQMLATAMARKGRRAAGTPKRTSARARSVTSDPEDAPVTSGLGLKYSDFYRDTSAPDQFKAGLEHKSLATQDRERAAAYTGRRIDQLDRMYDPEAAKAQPNARRAFGRSFTSSMLDAAALPVKAAGKALEYAGVPNAAANLDGREAADSIEWLASGRTREPADIRHEERRNGAEYPVAGWAGETAGGMVGSAPMGALTSRLTPAAGYVLNAAKRTAEKKPVLDRGPLPRTPEQLLARHEAALQRSREARENLATTKEAYKEEQQIRRQIVEESLKEPAEELALHRNATTHLEKIAQASTDYKKARLESAIKKGADPKEIESLQEDLDYAKYQQKRVVKAKPKHERNLDELENAFAKYRAAVLAGGDGLAEGRLVHKAASRAGASNPYDTDNDAHVEYPADLNGLSDFAGNHQIPYSKRDIAARSDDGDDLKLMERSLERARRMNMWHARDVERTKLLLQGGQ